MTENCELVSEWMLGNKVKLNADKTHLMTVGTSERLRSLDDKVNVIMDGFTLVDGGKPSWLPDIAWPEMAQAG